jgi:hypothetical protein
VFVFCRHAVRKNADVLLTASEEIGRDVNAEDAQQNYRVNVGN